MDRIATLAGLGLALSLNAVQAGDVQKWVDADGNIHFGDAPPPQVHSQTHEYHRPVSVEDFKAFEARTADVPEPEPESALRQALRAHPPEAGMPGYRVREYLGKPARVTTLSYGLGREDRWTYVDDDGATAQIVIKNDEVASVQLAPSLRAIAGVSAEGVAAADTE